MDLDDLAPGLKQLPETLGFLRAAADSGDWGSLADPGRVESYAAALLIGAPLYLGSTFVIGRKLHPRAAPARARYREEEDEVKRDRNTPLLSQVWWGLHPPHDLMTVDGLVLPRTGKRSHCLWLGPTGYGKSASVATVRVNGRRPTLIVTPDLSDPMINACRKLRGFHWTAGGKRAVDFLIGTPLEVAERLTEVFRSGGAGVWKMTARRATEQVIRLIDATGQKRTLRLIGELLQSAIAKDRELKQACAGWVERFLSTALLMGDSIAAGGVNIADLLNRGMTVLLDNNAFDHPGLRGDVVAFVLAEAKRLAGLVKSGFRLIFEEAQQLGERIELADPFFLAGRRRRIAVDALCQSEDALDDAITQNSATRVYFAQRRKTLQKAADDVLDIGYKTLDPARMADYTAWIASERIRRLVKFPKPLADQPDPEVSRRATTENPSSHPAGRQQPVDPRSITRIEEVRYEPRPEPVVERLALPPPGTEFQAYLDRIYEENGHTRWRGKHDVKGYGYIYLEVEEKSVLVHRWRWEQAFGPIGRDPKTGKKLTVDHDDECPRDCSKLVHLKIKTRGDNSRARWAAARRGVVHP